MKRVRYVDGALDALDTKILAALAADARTPMRELAQKIWLSAPSTTERVRRLESAGVIEGYTVRVNPDAIGLPLAAILRIRPMPGELERVAGILVAIPQITSCDRVTGDDCFIAKAQVPSVSDLEALIDGLLPYASTNTCVVVSTLVASRLPAASL
jgi:Lrp/AsnC family transcriptional regulator, leucine-responsive regulatory protein